MGVGGAAHAHVRVPAPSAVTANTPNNRLIGVFLRGTDVPRNAANCRSNLRRLIDRPMTIETNACRQYQARVRSRWYSSNKSPTSDSFR
jgi:hypothetical protein